MSGPSTKTRGDGAAAGRFPRPRTVRASRAALAVVSVGLCSLVVGLAVATLLRPAEDPLAANDYTTVQVRAGEVESSMRVNAGAEWRQTRVGVNRASGVVTRVHVRPGDEVRQGDRLYAVDERTVVVARGTVPAYRSLARGDEGEDVRQLQAMLKAVGFYAGERDGRMGLATVLSVKAWQESIGVRPTGSVEVGDVMF
ncbi:MAG: peptidoglycan-binding protein, partial [Comamonadaceae bacterium]